jgi:hypothetical protein
MSPLRMPTLTKILTIPPLGLQSHSTISYLLPMHMLAEGSVRPLLDINPDEKTFCPVPLLRGKLAKLLCHGLLC